jgi:two-component system, chemotaxis family, chemotaxis protein CheY
MAVDLAMPILVVEDNRTMGQIVNRLLTQIGFRDVENAFDGHAALAKLHTKEFGLVISDWNMRPMSGHMLLLEIRSDPLLKAIPFIVLTAESTLAAATAAKNAGADGYIVKPFTGTVLKSKINSILGSDAKGS